MKNGKRPHTARTHKFAMIPGLLAAAFSLVGNPAQAFPVDTGNPDFKLRWDNTFKYSAAMRLKDRSDVITESAPTIELAPGLFSTMKDLQKRCSSLEPISRANRL